MECTEQSHEIENTVNFRYLEVKVNFKLLVSRSKFSSQRKFTLRYTDTRVFEEFGIEMSSKTVDAAKICSLV